LCAFDNIFGISVADGRAALTGDFVANGALAMRLNHSRVALLLVVLSGLIAGARVAGQAPVKLDPLLLQRAPLLTGASKVVITAANGASISAVRLLVQTLGGTNGRTLGIINGTAATLPNTKLNLLSASGLVTHVALDRIVAGANERTGLTTGATAIRQQLGVDGAGVTVAVIDSGIFAAHADFGDTVTGLPRVARFVDFVNNAASPYDDYGHGTHVAGIVAGNGADSNGARAGIAPSAQLVVLKVLDGSGSGRISDVLSKSVHDTTATIVINAHKKADAESIVAVMRVAQGLRLRTVLAVEKEH
jgi:hypothetical protein